MIKNPPKDASKIRLVKPVALIKREVSFDWKGIFVHGGKTVVNFFTKGVDGAVLSAMDLANDLGLKQQPEQVAWVLICQAMLANVNMIIEDSGSLFKTEPSKADKAQLGEDLAIQLNDGDYFIDNEFFNKPQHHPCVSDFLTSFEVWLQRFGLNEASAQVVGRRFTANFALALHNQWAADNTLFALLFTNINSPFSDETQKQQQWRNYHHWLSAQVHQRMFEEAFSLVDLYVKPTAYYLLEDQNEQIEVDLHQELTDWVTHFNCQDAFRVVSGSPGAGKSSMAKMLAVEWGETLQVPVLFIPLHHFNLTTNLVSAVKQYIADQSCYLSANPLDPKHGESRMVLICDGLDELAEQGKLAAEMARDFVLTLLQEINAHNSQNCQRQVLLTGRDLSIDSIMTYFRQPKQLYHLVGFSRSQQDLWWQKYGQASGNGYEKMPEVLSVERLAEVVAQPLLSYLVALSYVRGKVDFKHQTSLNEIYQDLLVSVYGREQDKNINNITTQLSQEKFIRILEEIALAVWHGNGRTATVAAIEKQCEASHLLQSLSYFRQSAEHGVTKLLTAFYFRQSRHQSDENGHSDKTFEFTHKSFGEYLMAKRLVRLVKKVCTQLDRHNQDPDDGWTVKQALVEWIAITGATAIDVYLHAFIQDEVLLAGSKQCADWQSYILTMLNYSINNSLPMENIQGLSYPQMCQQARNSDESLLVLLNACAQVTQQRSKIAAKQATGFGQWFRRLQLQRSGSYNCVAYACLSYLDLSGSVMDLQDFCQGNLAHSDLSHSKITCTCFFDTDLTKADLRGADLTGADLTEADLTEADLRGADLREADLTGARFSSRYHNKSMLSSKQLKQIKRFG